MNTAVKFSRTVTHTRCFLGICARRSARTIARIVRLPLSSANSYRPDRGVRPATFTLRVDFCESRMRGTRRRRSRRRIKRTTRRITTTTTATSSSLSSWSSSRRSRLLRLKVDEFPRQPGVASGNPWGNAAGRNCGRVTHVHIYTHTRACTRGTTGSIREYGVFHGRVFRV